MTFTRRSRSDADITLTPLIDILFIVLLFLVLTATFTKPTVLRIAVPRAEASDPSPNDPDAVRILVDAQGHVYIDDRVRTLDEIGTYLRSMPDKHGAVVRIAADEQASHGRVIQVVDLIRQAGIFRLDIETFRAAMRNQSP